MEKGGREMPTGQYNHPLFGLVNFKTKHDTWVRGDDITFVSGFDGTAVTSTAIPQLKAVPGAHAGKLAFHKRGQAQLVAVFADLEALGLLKYVKDCGGTFVPRLRRPTSGALSKLPSNHSFGTAIDLNPDDGSNGLSVAPVAPVFTAHGFVWGNTFRAKDPMHFEIDKFIDGDKSSVQPVSVTRQGSALPVGAMNIFGKLYLDVSKLKAVPGLKVAPTSASSLGLSGKTSKTVKKLIFGDLAFVPLPEAFGVAGLAFGFDNAAKAVTVSDS
jgi:D-alanyl-D-alanine carboxypeptidase